MFDLTDIFEKIIDTFDDTTFAEKNFVCNTHKFVFHIFHNFGNKMNAVGVELFKQRSRNTASVSEQFTKHFFGEFRDNLPISIVNIACSKAKSDDFTFVIDGKMEFKAKEPAC
jgi:hypothetical protein